jgi:hypothetical protein
MAKTKAPLFSLNATGTLDKTITYKKNLQNNIAQKYSQPGAKNPFESSPRQKDQRSIIRLITIHWQCMSSSDKLSWEVAAKDKRFKGSGYHYFLHMAQQNLTQYLGLVGYWSMNYNIDENIPDLSGNGNDGILSPIYPCDCPQPADGLNKKLGNSLLFDGLNEYVSCGNDPIFNITSAITLEALVKTSTSSGSRLLLTKWIGYSLESYNPGTPKGVFVLNVNGANFSLKYNTSHIDGAWHYLAATYSSITKTMTVYLDGVKDNSLILSGLPTYLISASSADLDLGFYSTVFFKGFMDEARVYNRLLSDIEILKHAQI